MGCMQRCGCSNCRVIQLIQTVMTRKQLSRACCCAGFRTLPATIIFVTIFMIAMITVEETFNFAYEMLFSIVPCYSALSNSYLSSSGFLKLQKSNFVLWTRNCTLGLTQLNCCTVGEILVFLVIS